MAVKKRKIDSAAEPEPDTAEASAPFAPKKRMTGAELREQLREQRRVTRMNQKGY
jgi:hypothetical protein